MSNQPISKPSSTDKSEGIVAAQQELNVLDVLARGVSAQMVELSKKPQSLGQIDNNELALIDNRHARLQAYRELAHRVYGRAVIGTEVDENDRPKSAFTYRITQANIGFVEKGCVVLARNSRLATQLVTAQPGDEREIETPTAERFLSVREVRTLDGPVSLRSPNQEPNFRSMAIRRRDLKKPIVVDDLRATVQHSDLAAEDEITELAPQAEPRSFDDTDPTWLVNWNRIYVGDSDNQALGHQFITRTTIDQERALSNPRGLTFVEGVAGAGKTSVALGRLKFFANFETGAERDQYGLQNASEKDFAPAGMMGFVLSHSLKRYLKDTADALELIHLPIRDFEEFRVDLSNKFGVSERFRKKKGENSSLRARIAWLRALDVAMARAAGVRLRENISKAQGIPTRVTEAAKRLVTDLSEAESSSEIRHFYLSELATRVVGVISEAELREEEERARVKFPVTEKADNERRRIEERNLGRELRRIQQQADRKLVSSLARTLLEGLTSQALFSAAVAHEGFPILIQDSFATSAEPASSEVLDGANRRNQKSTQSRRRAAKPTGMRSGHVGHICRNDSRRVRIQRSER
jgi:hypothetical protein